jgi:hypothetical protein
MFERSPASRNPVRRLPMSDPAGQNAELVSQRAEMKRRQRYATVAGFVTLLIVIVIVFQVGSDTLKSYSFFVGVVPAFIVYFLIASSGLKRPKP